MKAWEALLIAAVIVVPGMVVMAVGSVLQRRSRNYEVHLVTETVVPALAISVMIAMAILVTTRVIV